MAGYTGSGNRSNPMDALRAVIQAEVGEINTVIDGEIVSYDRATQRATVRPKLEQTIGGKTIKAPDLENIKIAMPGGGPFGAHYDMAAGDPVILQVRQRNTDTSQTDGGNAEGGNTRSYDLSDAIAYPGGGEDSKTFDNMPAGGAHYGSKDGKQGLQTRGDGSSAIVGGPSGGDRFKVGANGGVDIVGETGVSLLDVIRAFLVAFRDHTNTGAPLDSPFVATANTLIAQIDGMKA